MENTFYRGDSRSPSIIARTGFTPRNTRELHTVKNELLSYCQNGLSPTDLSRKIISSPQSEYVSTDTTENCGGYSDKGYVYIIQFNNLIEKKWTESVLGIKPSFTPNAFTPKLLLNANTLSEATIVVLKHFGNVTTEVTFLTPIPPKNIIKYKKNGESKFIVMDGHIVENKLS